MSEIGVFTPEQARLLWQDYLSRSQLSPAVSKNYPQRRPIDEVSPHRVFVKNTAEETCPAYGCMQITGTDVVGGRTVVTISKPTDTDGEYLFNSQFAIAAGECGWAYRFGVVVMLGDPPYPVGTADYQPMVDEWTVEEGGGPFTVFGPHDAADNGLIGRFSGGGAGSTIVFQPFEIAPGIGSWCVAVRAIVISAQCGSGVQEGDVVEVWDRTEGADHFGVPLELLMLMTGYAIKMKVSAAERYALPVDPGPCRYEVIRMNCTESEAVVY